MPEDVTQSIARADTEAATASGPAPAGPSGFDLLGEVGRGGMGVVWRARDRALDREVAVKLLSDKYAAGSSAAARFLDEARITGQLQHPGVPAVYQVGQLADGRPFLAMKLIKGDTLDDLLKAKAPVDVLAVFAAVAQAVGYAHAHGVIHRDLKPANVMVGAFGEVQVMDWGLAKVLAVGRPREQQAADPGATTAPTEIRSLRDTDGSLTQAGSLLGTPAYLAPEQAAGETDRVDARSDVFGPGALLCALLTGKPPFEGTDAEDVRRSAVRCRMPDALARLDGCGADPGVVALCKLCLAAEPADRPADGAAVASEVAALRRAADDRAKEAELAAARAEVHVVEQRRRRRVLLWAGGALAAVLAAGVAGTAVGLVRAEGKRAETEAARQAEEMQKTLAQVKEAETAAVLQFVDDKVFVAARPVGQQGGLGKDVTLRKALDAAAPVLAAGFPDQPLTEARLRLTIGQTYGYLGEWPAAEEQARRARTLYAGHRGPDHPDTLRAASRLAESLLEQREGMEAVSLLEDTVRLQTTALGLDHPDTLASLFVLANTYHQLGRSAEAVAAMESVVERRKAVLGPDHLDTYRSMFYLAERFRLGGRAAEAATLLESMIERQQATLGPNHLSTLSSKGGLANCYRSLGRLAEGLALQEQVVKGRAAALGPDHPFTLQAALSLTISLEGQGRVQDALRVAEDSLKAAAGREGDPAVAAFVLQLRVLACDFRKDPAGFRAALTRWEEWRKPSSVTDLYNLACWNIRLSALVRVADPSPAGAKQADADADRAMDCLRTAVAAGYRNLANMEQDTSLDGLRGRDDFKQLLASIRSKTAAPGPAK